MKYKKKLRLIKAVEEGEAIVQEKGSKMRAKGEKQVDR